MIKALFFDIDGTLVSFKTHEIPASTIKALTEAKAKGIHIFISTGRPGIIINNLAKLQQRNLIDGYITMNGAYCYVGRQVIYKNRIPMADVETLTRFCQERNIPCIVVGEQRICACQPDVRIRQIFLEHLKVTTPIPTCSTEEAIADGNVFQLTPFINEAEEEVIAPQIPHCEIGRWHPAFVDVTGAGNTKQRGMEVILRHFDIPRQAAMAFGDGGNDISMLAYAGTGVAMGNAADHVKAAADHVTSSVDDDGIARALQAFGISSC